MLFRSLAKHLNCTVMATGKKDLIADAENAFLVSNGHAALSGVTGTGCMVGALTAAYLPGSKAIFTKSGIFETSSIIPDKTKVSYGTAAALLAAVAMGISGELAAEISKGPGSFQTALLDEVYAMTDETLLEKTMTAFSRYHLVIIDDSFCLRNRFQLQISIKLLDRKSVV